MSFKKGDYVTFMRHGHMETMKVVWIKPDGMIAVEHWSEPNGPWHKALVREVRAATTDEIRVWLECRRDSLKAEADLILFHVSDVQDTINRLGQ